MSSGIFLSSVSLISHSELHMMHQINKCKRTVSKVRCAIAELWCLQANLRFILYTNTMWAVQPVDTGNSAEMKMFLSEVPEWHSWDENSIPIMLGDICTADCLKTN